MKKILILIMLLMPTIVKADAYSVKIGNVYYNLRSSTKIASVTYRGLFEDNNNAYSGSIIIPENIVYNGDTYCVTGINNYAFYGCPDVTSVTIPKSIDYIGFEAFQGCIGLTRVTIGNGVTSIGDCAFYTKYLETSKLP